MCGNFTATKSLQTNFTTFTKIHIFLLLKMDDDDIIIGAMCLLLSCTMQVTGHDVTEETAFYMGMQLFVMPPQGECVLQSTSPT